LTLLVEEQNQLVRFGGDLLDIGCEQLYQNKLLI
jgi:hypothetical protein